MHAEGYHVGIAVADLGATARELANAIGIRWGRPRDRRRLIGGPAGSRVLDFRTIHSTPMSGAMLLELIEGGPESPWSLPDGVAASVHHLGFYVDDVGERSEGLRKVGACPEAWGGGGAVAEGFAYHTVASGLRLEITDIRGRPALLNWLAG